MPLLGQSSTASLALLAMETHQRAPFTAVVLASLGAALLAQEPSGQLPYLNVDATASAAAREAASESWQRFVHSVGGEWKTRWCAATGTPKAIFGTGLVVATWRENSLVEGRRHAHELLLQQEELLGLARSEFRETIGSRMGNTWCFVFDQFYRGLPVIDGRADVRVHMTGRVSMFGSRAWPIPDDFVTVPVLDRLSAKRVAWQTLAVVPPAARQPGADKPSRLVIWGDVNSATLAEVHLAWEIPISAVNAQGLGAIGRYYIDAKTGAVLDFVNDKHDASPGEEPKQPLAVPAPSTGTVMAWTRIGTSGIAQLVNVPLPGVEVNVPGVGVVVTDNAGQFTVNITANTNVTVDLNGIHCQLIFGTSATQVSQTLIPNGTTTFQFLWNTANADLAAHTTAYYWTHLVNEWARTVFGNTNQINALDNVRPTVNITSICNAYYTANTINFYQAGGGCNNSAYASVVAHEWGHGLDDQYGGISQVDGLSESWGDICSMYLLDDPVIGENFQTLGGYLRHGMNNRQYPSGNGVHQMGEAFGGFAWKLRERLAVTLVNRAAAITLTDDIVLGTIAANAPDQPGAVLEVFLADDNDGNLANGTPHSTEIIFACNQHSLPYPGNTTTNTTNDNCATSIAVINGLNGPFTSVGAQTSSPAWPCGNAGADVWFKYDSTNFGTLQVELCNQSAFNTVLEIFSGDCGSLTSLGCNDDSCGVASSLSVTVQPGTYHIRVGGSNNATGPFNLDVDGPTGTPATATPYGLGCYRTSKAFYELFASAASFDLSGVAMRLIKSGDQYVVIPGGGFVAPSAAATSLTLNDDDEVTVSLTGQFPYPGGTTSNLVVCSNGFVSVAVGNGTAPTPTASDWLNSSHPRWGSWHNYDPSAASSGQVKFEQQGSVAYVTWDGVFSFGSTSANTWQLQFDLPTGNVIFVWQSMSGTGNEVLVGYAHTAPNADLGSMDLSIALPITFSTTTQNFPGLTLSATAPQLGSTLTLTTTEYPQASVLGIQVLSFIRHDPGIDLTPFGMPGCLQFVGNEATAVVLPVGGQSAFSAPIPNDTGFMGIVITSQTFALSPGANSLGLVSSNGVALALGT